MSGDPYYQGEHVTLYHGDCREIDLPAVCHWVRLDRFGNWLHDATIPDHDAGTGRG